MHKYYDYKRNSEEVSRRIRQVQKPWEDNATQEKHDERCKIALEVHGHSIDFQSVDDYYFSEGAAH